MRTLSILSFLFAREFATAWLLVRHRDRHTVELKTHKAEVLQQFTAFGQWIGDLVGNPLIVATAFIGITYIGHVAVLIAKQHIFHVVALFLAAIMRFLFSIVVWTYDRSLGAVMIKRGAASAVSSVSSAPASSCCSSVSSAPDVCCRSSLWSALSRSCKASRCRAGASPRSRNKVWCST